MMNPVNFLLQELAEQSRQDDVDAAYDEYIDALCAEHEMQMYAAYSYDADAIAYGLH